MEVKKALIKNKIYDVVSQTELHRRYVLAKNTDILKETCIEQNGTLYPVYSTMSYDKSKPFVFYNGHMAKYVGSCKDDPDYSSNKVIDFTNSRSTKELLEKQSRLKADEVAALTSNSDDVFTPITREEDSSALKLVKECLKAKNIEIDCYRTRFQSNCDYSNALRLLTNPDNHNISVSKLQLIGDKFDINFKLIAEDKSGAPNPMNKIIEKEL